MMNRLFTKWLIAGLGSVVLLLVANAVIAFRNTRQLHTDAHWVSHTQEVLDSLDDLLSTVKDAETGERGFLITGDERYLKPYDDARHLLDDKVQTLRRLTEDNERQQACIPAILQLIHTRLEQLSEIVASRKRPEFGAAKGQTRPDAGLQTMDAIRQQIGEMRREEHALLEDRRKANDRTYLVSMMAGVLASLMGLAAIGSFVWILRQHLKNRVQAAAEISKQRELLRTTLASIGDGVIATDTEGRVTFLNSVAQALTGWKEKEAQGERLETVFNIVNENTRKAVENPALRALREGVIVGLANHSVLFAKNGSERAIDDSAAPIKNESGALAGAVLVFRDVTEAREKDRLACFLASIVKSSDDAIIAKDVNGIITSWNEGAERIFGYTADEVIGRPVAMLAPPDRVDEMPGILDRIRHGERVEHFDTTRLGKNGRLVPISLTVSPIRNEDGQIIGASKVARDITERKQAEEALFEEKERLQATLTGIGDAVIATDANGLVILMNPIARALTGWQDEAIGRPLDEIFRIINEQTRHSAENPVNRVIREGIVVGLANHTVLIARDGTERPIEDSAAPVRGKAGEIAGVVLVFRDASERRAAEEAAREADRRKDEFLAILAHELRNPLAPIRNCLELLQRRPDNAPEAREARNIMGRQINQMVRLIDDLLDVTRIGQGKVQLRKERVELAGVVDHALEATRPLIEEKGDHLTVDLPGEPVYLDADPARLAQVIANLIENAAKYSERGGHIWLSGCCQGGEVFLSVRDDGIGISAEHLHSIFEIFSQVAPALERSHGGLGIGLTLARRIVELHDGQVVARSDGVGKGSEFIVRLPIARGPVPSQPTELAHMVRPPSERKYRVLVVDDLPDAANSLAKLLPLLGHDTRTAYNGFEAIEAAKGFRPDVVLLDIGLPKLNGYETARQIKQQPWGQGIKLIAVTGWGQEEDKRRALEAGFDHHLTKPVNLAALQNLLEDSVARDEG
jgi:PAS domain S-box-containing protein